MSFQSYKERLYANPPAFSFCSNSPPATTSPNPHPPPPSPPKAIKPGPCVERFLKTNLQKRTLSWGNIGTVTCLHCKPKYRELFILRKTLRDLFSTRLLTLALQPGFALDAEPAAATDRKKNNLFISAVAAVAAATPSENHQPLHRPPLAQYSRCYVFIN